jgi:hypothetical protein
VAGLPANFPGHDIWGNGLRLRGCRVRRNKLSRKAEQKENIFDLVAYIQPNPRVRFFLRRAIRHLCLQGRGGRRKGRPELRRLRGLRIHPQRRRNGTGGESPRPAQSRIHPVRYEGPAICRRVRIGRNGRSLRRGPEKDVLRGFFSRGFQFSIYSGASYYLWPRATAEGSAGRYRGGPPYPTIFPSDERLTRKRKGAAEFRRSFVTGTRPIRGA